MNPVVVVRTGSANLASVVASLERLDERAVVTDDPGLVRSAGLLVLPGVGSFGAAMRRLESSGCAQALRERIAEARPLLAICLGLQLLLEESEESQGVGGLGVVQGRAERFGPGVRVPQMGWNFVAPTPGCGLIEAASMYFANSYRLREIPVGWEGATSEHGGTFVAALERGAVLACQFHPELSGKDGRAVLARWLARAREAEGARC